jgi:hypothetical protein
MLANYVLYVHMSADLGLLFSLRVRKTLQRRLCKLGITVFRVKSIKKSTIYALPPAGMTYLLLLSYKTNITTFKWALKAHLLESID